MCNDEIGKLKRKHVRLWKDGWRCSGIKDGEYGYTMKASGYPSRTRYAEKIEPKVSSSL